MIKDLLTGKMEIFSFIFTLCLSFILYYFYKCYCAKLHKSFVIRNVKGPPAYPIIGSSLEFLGRSKDVLKIISNIFKTYRPVNRIWLFHKLLIGISEPEHLKVVLNCPKSLAKSDLYDLLRTAIGQGLFTASVSIWKMHRKMVVPAFHPKNLKWFVNIFSEQSNILVNQLRKYEGKGEFDIFHAISACTLDSILETAIGVKSYTQTSTSKYSEAVDYCMMVFIRRAFQPWMHPEFVFKYTPTGRLYYKRVKEVHAYMEKIISEKRSEIIENKTRKIEQGKENGYTSIRGSARQSVLSLIIESEDQGNRMSTEELRDELNTIVIGGSDTSASSIGFVLVMLGMHPDIQENVLDEIMKIIGPGKEVEYDDLIRLDYMERVIKETLRLFPVGSIIGRNAETDIDLGDGYIIPNGSTIVLNILHVHRNESHWINPLKFDPNRFLPDEVSKRHPYSYIPFSGGPRNCIGMKYGMLVMKSVIAYIVRNYQITTSYRSVEDIQLELHMVTRPVRGYRISLESRTK